MMTMVEPSAHFMRAHHSGTSQYIKNSNGNSQNMAERQRLKCLGHLKRKRRIMVYLSKAQLTSLQGKRPWLNTYRVLPEQWQAAFNAETRPKYYFALGSCLGGLLEKATPEAAVDYLFSLQIVIKYYRFLEIKQEDIIRKTLKKEIKKNSKKESKRESNKDVKKESENENGVGLGLGLAPTNSSRSSINNSIISSSATHSIQDKTNKGISFTKRLLRRSTPNTASPKSVSPASSRSSLGSSSFHGSMTPLTPLTPSSPMPLTGSMNSPQTRKTSMGSSKQQTSNINEFKKSDLPRDIWKDSRALHVLNAANLIHESALSFMPDPYQSCLSVLELMAVIYDDISFMLENSRYNFVSLSEMEYSLISIEENLFSMLIGQAFQIIDAATLDIPFGCQPRDVGMLLGHLESMVVS